MPSDCTSVITSLDYNLIIINLFEFQGAPLNLPCIKWQKLLQTLYNNICGMENLADAIHAMKIRVNFTLFLKMKHTEKIEKNVV